VIGDAGGQWWSGGVVRWRYVVDCGAVHAMVQLSGVVARCSGGVQRCIVAHDDVVSELFFDDKM
jgi:hypothetical protein